MATHATLAKLGQNMQKFGEANVIFLKKCVGKCCELGEYQVIAFWGFWQIREIFKLGSF
jgi:hypothetical protein